MSVYLFRNYFTLEIGSILQEKKKIYILTATRTRTEVAEIAASVSARLAGRHADPRLSASA